MAEGAAYGAGAGVAGKLLGYGVRQGEDALRRFAGKTPDQIEHIKDRITMMGLMGAFGYGEHEGWSWDTIEKELMAAAALKVGFGGARALARQFPGAPPVHPGPAPVPPRPPVHPGPTPIEPTQTRIPAGQPGAGQWAQGSRTQYQADLAAHGRATAQYERDLAQYQHDLAAHGPNAAAHAAATAAYNSEMATHQLQTQRFQNWQNIKQGTDRTTQWALPALLGIGGRDDWEPGR
jgi:hypothetical protein